MKNISEDSTVEIYFNTVDSDGAPVAPSSAFVVGDFAIHKDGSATEKTSTNGLTVTSPFDTKTGLHLLSIDTSNDTGDAGFWTSEGRYMVRFNTATTVDSVSIDGRLVPNGEFGIDIPLNLGKINGEAQPTINLAYPDGYIYIDTVAGTSGTTAGVNGTKFNPVDTIANAMTLSDSGSVGIKKFNVWGSSSITLAASAKGYTFEGAGYSFDPNGQNVSYATIRGANLNSSSLPSAGDNSRYYNCYLNGATIGDDAFYYDPLISSVTLNGNVHIENGRCAALPESESQFSFESGVSVRARILDWQGDARLYGMGVGSANHKVRIHGGGTVTIDATSTIGSIYLVGDITVVDEVAGGFLGTLVHEYMPEKVRVEMDDNSTDLDLILANVSGVQTTADTIFESGSSAWTTATGFATPSNVTDAQDTVIASGTSAWTTATGFATPANVTAAQDTIIASGSDWVTASGFNTVVPDNSGIATIRVKTDQMNFGVTNQLDANIESINTVGVSGAGTSGNKWRGS